MHHFKMKTREVVEVYHFEGIEAVNSLRDVMTNYVSQLIQKRKDMNQDLLMQIIAPKLFLYSRYEECNLIHNGTVETRNTGNKYDATTGKSDKVGLRYEGIIFPQAVSQIAALSRDVISSGVDA